MNNKIAKKNLVDLMEKERSLFSYYGIFFDGKLVCVTKARVYLQPGRAVSELINQNKYALIRSMVHDTTLNYTQTRKAEKNAIKEAIDELIKEGRLEIKNI